MSDIYLDLAKLITSSLDFDEILNRMMREVEHLFKPDNWSLLRYDSAAKELFFVIARGLDSSALKGMRLKLGEGVAGHVAQTQQTLIINDVSKDTRFCSKVDQTTGFITQSIIAVPLVFQKNILGVLELININKKLTTEKKQLLEAIADFTAVALHNAALFQSTLMRAEYDPLTGVYNRGKLNTLIKLYLENSLNRLRELDRYTYICVALIDVDNFKDINDQFGHPYGDKVLQQLARELVASMRHNDMVFRIGGDEFLIVAENIMQQDEACVLRQLTNKLTALNGQFNMAEFSYGVCSGQKRNIKTMIVHADQSMYQAKSKKHR